MSDDARPPVDPVLALRLDSLFATLGTPWILPATQRDEVPEYLWHYTDGSGAAGIIENAELWATDVLFMNDPSELTLVRALFGLVLDEGDVLTPALPDDDERRIFLGSFWESLEGLVRDPGVFAVCFSEHGDLLNQWRTYGQRGGGYALGFDGASVAQIAASAQPYLFFKVLYDVDAHLQAGRDVLHAALQPIQQFDAEPDVRLAAIEAVARDLADTAQILSARIKHGAFADESEWRLVYRRNVPSMVEDEVLPRHFRSSGHRLVPYVKFGARALGGRHGAALPLSQVRMGPIGEIELNGRAMNYLLKDHGYDISVQPSGVPLRD